MKHTPHTTEAIQSMRSLDRFLFLLVAN